MCPHSPRRAFSLVELLAVIGILAVLLAILFPAITRAREQSYQAKCLTTLRSIGQAALLHAVDHGDYLPTAGWQWNCTDGVCHPEGLQDPRARHYEYYRDGSLERPLPVTAALARYLGVRCRVDSRQNLTEDLSAEALRRLFRCPMQRTEYSAWTQRGDGQQAGSWIAPDEVSSYTFNEALLGRRDYNTPGCPKGKLTRVKDSSRVFFAADGRPRDQDGNRAFLIPDDRSGETLYDVQQYLLTFEPNRGREALDFTRHRMRITVVFCDGHAESLPMGLPPGGGDGLKEIYVSRGISY